MKEKKRTLINKVDEVIQGVAAIYIYHKIKSEKEHGKWDDEEEKLLYEEYRENRHKLEDIRNFIKSMGDKRK